MAEPSYEELQAELAELRKQGPAANRGGITFKVSAKGGVSAYGLGRFPVTLYYEQWTKLLEHVDPLRSFLAANKGSLHLRNQQPAS